MLSSKLKRIANVMVGSARDLRLSVRICGRGVDALRFYQ